MRHEIMKYSLLYIAPIEDFAPVYEKYRVLCQGIDSQLSSGCRKLGQSSWLIPSDEMMRILVNWGVKMKNLELKVEVAEAGEVAWTTV